MARPRTYDPRDVVEAAKEAFWEGGYAGTAIADLERSTGLNRSSLYLAFGSKRELFQIALDRYTEDFIDPLVGGMEKASAGLDEIVEFFSKLKAEFRQTSRRGCLMVNTIAEVGDRSPQAVAYRDRIRGALTHALRGASRRGETQGAAVRRRVSMLQAATLGVWLSSRIDPRDARSLCDEIAAEVESWRQTGTVASSLRVDA
jgi:TetR/AcrR family transcriptional regulator, transcriptional repressor for nem operon